MGSVKGHSSAPLRCRDFGLRTQRVLGYRENGGESRRVRLVAAIYVVFMQQRKLAEELSARLSELLAASPARDIEKNLRALLGAALGRADLATREEFDVQAKLLARARDQLTALEARVAELERQLGK